MIVNALTHSPGGKRDVIKTPVKIQNTFTQSEVNTLAIWDTGATNCVITKSIASQLGLPVVSRTKVRGVHGEKEVNVYIVRITLNNQNITMQTLVTECEELSESLDTGMLIGMNLITQGDFSISSYQGHTVMTFRTPSIERIVTLQTKDKTNAIFNAIQDAIEYAKANPEASSNLKTETEKLNEQPMTTGAKIFAAVIVAAIIFLVVWFFKGCADAWNSVAV